MYAAFPRSEYLWASPTSTVASASLRMVLSVGLLGRHANQDGGGSPRFLTLPFPDVPCSKTPPQSPAIIANSDRLLFAFQVFDPVGLRMSTHEAQSLHLRYGLSVALPTLSSCRYLHQPKARFQVGRLDPLPVRESHPLEAPSLAWRAEIGARQIIEQHVVADVEQIAPASHQMIEERLLVHQQPVMAAVQLVDLGEPGILAQEIGQGAALKPLAVQPPFAARRQQAVGDQHEQNLVPARPLAARSQPLGPEQIELQLAPQQQRQPARAPLPRPAQLQLRQLDADNRGVRQ